jgi:hypothetical protein
MFLDQLSNPLPFFLVFLNSPECKLPTHMSVDEDMPLPPPIEDNGIILSGGLLILALV